MQPRSTTPTSAPASGSRTIAGALERLGSRAQIIDSASAMAADVARSLDEHGIARDPAKPGELSCFVTDLPASFEESATRFLGEPPGDVKVVDI